MALLTRARDEGPEPCCGCAGCRARATRRLALTIGHCTAALVPLCTGHAEDVRHHHWAMQVEDDWGGALLDGRQAPLARDGGGVGSWEAEQRLPPPPRNSTSTSDECGPRSGPPP